MEPKPPLGLRPYFIEYEARIAEIVDAMARYVHAGKAIPDLWLWELQKVKRLLDELKELDKVKGIEP